MNDTEDAVRRLFTAATEDIPPGIDLLRGVRTRSRARAVRVRALAAAGTAGIAAAAVAITLSVSPAPSALAQVTQAAARTAAQSYRVSSTSTLVQGPGAGGGVVAGEGPRAGGGVVAGEGPGAGGGPQPPVTVSGEFDPAQRVGEETTSTGLQIRYVGGYMYLPLLKAFVTVYDRTHTVPVPAGASWLRLPTPLRPGGDATVVELAQLGTILTGLEQFSPQDLLALLESATQVRETGPASGPGWTGTAYTFAATMRLPGALHMVLGISGRVDVDQQGRVRQLDATEAIGNTVRKVQMTFGDFGLPVSVSAPPASETFAPETKGIVIWVR